MIHLQDRILNRYAMKTTLITKEDEILIVKQKDGNWKGWMLKYGKLIEVREVKPEDCLTMLLTHNGK